MQRQLRLELIKLVLIIFILFGTFFPLSLRPLDAYVSQNIVPELFPPNIYRVAEHVHSVDESVVTNHYYSKFVIGYDALFFAYQSNHLADHDIEDADFESAVPLAYWALEKEGSFLNGYPVIERSNNQKYTGNYSLHLKTSSASNETNDPSYAGITQKLTHPSPLSANLNVSYKIFPVRLTSQTGGIDSQIQVRFNLLHWNSSDVFPAIVFTYVNASREEFESNFLNDTQTVYILRQAVPNSWNNVSENLTEVAESYWGQEFMLDQAVHKTDLRVIGSNNGIAEVYLDHLRKNVTLLNSDVYRVQADQIARWSTPEFKMFPGEELNGVSNLFSLNVPANKFIESARGTNGPKVDISKLHNMSLYAGLAHPFQNESQLNWAQNSTYDVDMIDIYGNKGCLFEPDTRVWDHYLRKGTFAMATATPNVHAPLGIERMNNEGYAMYVFSNSSNAEDLVENIATGRSFIESMSIVNDNQNTTTEPGPPMSLYFTTARDQVPMGRYPIIVDANTKEMDLHVIVTNIPSSVPHVNFVIKKDGITIHNPIPINGGTTKFDHTFSVPITFNGNHTYFRYEIQDASSGRILAFSQPLIFIKASSPIFSNFWTALVPQNSAAFDLDRDSVSFQNNVLIEKVKVRFPERGSEKLATLKIFIPNGVFENDDFSVSVDPYIPNSSSYSFDHQNRILNIHSLLKDRNSTTITVKANNGTVIQESFHTEKKNNFNKDQSALLNYMDASLDDSNEEIHQLPLLGINNSQAHNQAILNSTGINEHFNDNDTDSSLYDYQPFFQLNGSESSSITDDDSNDAFRLINFSLAAWFRTEMDVPKGCQAFIVNKGGIGSNEVGENMNYGIWLTGSKKIQAGFESQQGGTKYFVISPIKYGDNKWHYAIVTFNGSNLKLYIDGQKIAERATDGLLPDNHGTTPVRIGANSFRSDNGLFIGELDEIRIWNRAITEEEVLDAYRYGKFNTSGQVAHVPFG